MSESGNILVVEDERAIRQFLRISLTSQGFSVSEAATGALALDALLASQSVSHAAIDLVLLDLGLPDMDGQQVLSSIRQHSDVPIMVVSVRGHEAEKVRALDSGANDYVTKPFGIEELLARIRALLRRSLPPAFAMPYRHGDLCVDIGAHRITLKGQPVRLTPKEFSVLALLVSKPGRVVTQTHLLRHVWGAAHQDDTHYLRIVISRLRHKLGDAPQAPYLLQTEPGIGYRLGIEPDRAETPS